MSVILCKLLFFVLPALSAPSDLGVEPEFDRDLAPTVPAVQSTANVPEEEEGESESEGLSVLSFSLRVDTSYQAGGSVAQGFFLPGMRLTALGRPERHLDYRLALGQTREVSSVLLPQLLPVEAFIRLSNEDAENRSAPSRMAWRVGMFRPEFNPLWSPDLAELSLPDYSLTHQELFLSQDLGTELRYELPRYQFYAGVGAFNGNGVLAINTNNSKAFTLFIGETFRRGDFKLHIGGGLMGQYQSTAGNLSYKSDEIADLSVTAQFPGNVLQVTADIFFGNFQDSVRTTSPRGFLTTLNWQMDEGWGIFGRVEYLCSVPSVSDSSLLWHIQVGPTLRIGDPFSVYVLYDYLFETSLAQESSLAIKFRLVI